MLPRDFAFRLRARRRIVLFLGQLSQGIEVRDLALKFVDGID